MMAKSTTKRLLLITLVLSLVGFGLAQTKLTFWSWRTEDVDEYNEIIAGYEAEHPGVDIEFQAYETSTYQTVLSAALSAGEAGDIVHVRAYGNFETIADFLLPLDDQVPALADFPRLALDGERRRSDGRVYAVPFASQTLVVYYNTDIFSELGLAPPETWDEFLSTAQTIKDNGYIPLANGTATTWMNEVFMGVFGPNFYGAEFFDDIMAGEADFTDARFTGALEKLLELRPYMTPDFEGIDYATAQNLFANGLAAMFAGGSWEIANFRDLNPDLNFDLMPGPAAEAGQPQLVSWFLDGGYAVNAASPNQEEALEFVRFLATQEFGQQLTDMLQNISPIPGVVSTDPLLAKVAELNQTSTPYIMLVGFRYETPSGSVMMQERLPGMFAGEITPEQVGSEVTEGIATYFAPFQN
ncbi:MAG: extracellular solute-binding protein [Trueperaceae bacterium]|nr:MAG: extracellular solute-binding protein [Trueperaceae bacterium]